MMSDGDYSELCKEFNTSSKILATLKEVYDKRKTLPKEKWEEEATEICEKNLSFEELHTVNRIFCDGIPEAVSFENFVRFVYYDEANATPEQSAAHLLLLHDTDNSGFLELSELTEAFPYHCKETINMILTHFDCNGDGKFSKEELVDMIKLAQLSNRKYFGEDIYDVESVRLFFKIADRDQNGFIDEKELELFWKLFQAYDLEDEDKALLVHSPKAFMALADTDNDGKLTFEEFMGFFAMESPKVTPEIVAQIFMTLFDKDGDGSLDISEIQPFVEKKGIDCTATEFLEMCDANGDGKVSKEELVKMFRTLDRDELNQTAKDL